MMSKPTPTGAPAADANKDEKNEGEKKKERNDAPKASTVYNRNRRFSGARPLNVWLCHIP